MIDSTVTNNQSERFTEGKQRRSQRTSAEQPRTSRRMTLWKPLMSFLCSTYTISPDDDVFVIFSLSLSLSLSLAFAFAFSLLLLFFCSWNSFLEALGFWLLASWIGNGKILIWLSSIYRRWGLGERNVKAQRQSQPKNRFILFYFIFLFLFFASLLSSFFIIIIIIFWFNI